MTDLLTELARTNLAAAAGILAVLVLRRPARVWLGARLAYGLWTLPLLAGLAILLPAARAARAPIPIPSSLPGPAPDPAHAAVAWVGQGTPALATHDYGPLLLGLWVAGAAACLCLLAWRQVQFMRLVAEGRAGPAVTGFFAPRIVVPSGFKARFSLDERRVILAHERVHIERQDARINTLIALATCMFWFNPLIRLAGFCLRMDQELACDAVVMARSPGARHTYAQAMLKTQLAPAPLPFGCYWPARSRHPLEERVTMLTRPAPGRARTIAGGLLVAGLGLSGAYGAWASQPPRPALAPVAAYRLASPALHAAPAGLAIGALPTAQPRARPAPDPAARQAPDEQAAGEPSQVYAASQRPTEAVSASGLAPQPDNVQLAAVRGETLADQRRWLDALTVFDNGLRGAGSLPASEHARLLQDKGQALIALGRLSDAQQAYDDAARIQPPDPAMLHEMDDLARRRAAPAG